MKNICAFAICGVLVLLPFLCKAEQKAEIADAPMMTGNMQLVNPFEDFAALKEAEKSVGFSIVLPSTVPAGYSLAHYRTLVQQSKVLEVIYKNGNKEIRIRKGNLEKISGMYGPFSEIVKVDVKGVAIQLSGKQGKFQLAEWKDADYSYSISAITYNEKDFTTGGGIAQEEMIAMARDMLTK